ncbi:MAG: hypothetical protein ACI4M3_01795 [Acutalibacteraceae bacterium]
MKQIANEQGTKTVLDFLSSKVFFSLPLFFILTPLFLVFTLIQSKTVNILFRFDKSDISSVLPGIIFIALIVIADFIAFLIMHKLYKISFSYDISNKKIFAYFTFLQALLIVSAIIFLSLVQWIFMEISFDKSGEFSGNLSKLFSPNNLETFLPWNVKFFTLLILFAASFLFCIGLTRWILSVEKTLKTDKIYVNGTAFLNITAIIDCIVILVNAILMLIEQDWIFVLFLFSMFAFNVAIIFNTMKYFKLCNKSLATQYDSYIAELHEDKDIEYYDTFADRTEGIAQEETFSSDETPYEMDAGFENFDFYVSEKVETDTQTDAHISGTCPVCNSILHGEDVCPKCGYIMHKSE